MATLLHSNINSIVVYKNLRLAPCRTSNFCCKNFSAQFANQTITYRTLCFELNHVFHNKLTWKLNWTIAVWLNMLWLAHRMFHVARGHLNRCSGDIAMCVYSFCILSDGSVGVYDECDGWDPIRGMPMPPPNWWTWKSRRSKPVWFCVCCFELPACPISERTSFTNHKSKTKVHPTLPVTTLRNAVFKHGFYRKRIVS